MKQLLIFFLSMLLVTGCVGKSPKTTTPEEPVAAVPDTGFTGIKKVVNANGQLAKEVSYKNGIRHGETKTFSKEGNLYQSFWYENDLREDTSRWYYAEGQVFRATPYIHDTIHGTVIQYYRNKVIRAKIGYNKGLRTPYLEEFNRDGYKYTDYPTIVTNITDEYATKGTYKIDISLSQKDKNVYFYRGSLVSNCLDTSRLELLKVDNSKTSIILKKSSGNTTDTIGIIASVLTPYGNRYITIKSLNLPYKDLK